jgi:hypothetical protein
MAATNPTKAEVEAVTKEVTASLQEVTTIDQVTRLVRERPEIARYQPPGPDETMEAPWAGHTASPEAHQAYRRWVTHKHDRDTEVNKWSDRVDGQVKRAVDALVSAGGPLSPHGPNTLVKFPRGTKFPDASKGRMVDAYGGKPAVAPVSVVETAQASVDQQIAERTAERTAVLAAVQAATDAGFEVRATDATWDAVDRVPAILISREALEKLLAAVS